MNRSECAGKAGTKLLLGMLLLLVAGGAGVAAWWFGTETDRHLKNFARYGDEWDWLASHADQPRVQAAIRERLEPYSRVQDSLGPEAEPSTLSQLGRVVSRRPPTDDDFVALATRIWLRKKFPPAVLWVQGFATDPRVTGELRAELKRVADDPLRWQTDEHSSPLALGEMIGRLLDELEKRGIPPADPGIQNAVVSIHLRYELPAVLPRVKKLEGTHEMKQAVAAHLIKMGKDRGYKERKGEFAQVIELVVQLKLEPSDDLLAAVGQHGADPDAVKAIQAWGPEAGVRLVKVRDALPPERDWERSQTTSLVAKLGLAKVSYADIDKILWELAFRDRDAGLASSRDPGGRLQWAWVSPGEFHKVVESGLPRTIAALADLGASAVPVMVGIWKGENNRLRCYVTARALARNSPEILAAELGKLLDAFEAPARSVALKGVEESKNPPEMVLEWRRLAPAVYEGLAALCSLKSLPDEAIGCLWQAVSCPDSQLAQSAGGVLEKGLPVDRFVHGLFVYISRKPEYRVTEEEIWINMVTRRPESGPHVASALGRLLDRAGSPEAVPMIHKIVGLRSLAEIGQAGEKTVLERYAADTSTYLHEETKQRGNKVTTETSTRRFSDLAQEALRKIK